jgi:ribosomal protein L37AE/L43A
MTKKHAARVQELSIDQIEVLQQGWVERCPTCGSTTNEDDQSGILTCLAPECGEMWAEGTGKRVYVAA